MRLPPRRQEANGFTLVEAMITVVIVAILSSIALPNYFRQVQRTKQNEAASTLAQFQTTVASYFDEFNLLPGSWTDLNNVAVIMTDNGPASAGDFAEITLPGGEYSVSRTNPADNYYEFTATSTNNNASEYNVIACVCLSTGASDLKKGTVDSVDREDPVTPTNLVCRPCPG